MDVILQWPPLSRYITLASFAMSALAYGQILPVHYIPYVPGYIYTLKGFPQIWRLMSAFLLTGPQFSIIMDPYLLFTYSSSLERDSPRFTEPGSYFVYLAFNALVIILLTGHVLGSLLFMSPLILALAYTFSQDHPDRQMSLFILTFPGKYLPYALLAVTLVLGGQGAAFSSATGLISAHLYDFLTRIWPEFGGGSSWIQTPAIVKRWSGDEPGRRPAPQARGFGTSFGAAGPKPSTSSSSGGSSWTSQRGPGRRLGSD